MQKTNALRKNFANPRNKRQRRYEAVRAVVVDELDVEIAAKKFGYKTSTLIVLLREAEGGRLELFPSAPPRTKKKKLSSPHRREVVRMRNTGMSARNIADELSAGGTSISERTVERLLREYGFPKLPRRTHKELGVTMKNLIIPEIAGNIDFDKLKPFSIDCPVAGVFFFLPYIIESGILEVAGKCELPESSVIGAPQACLSMLLLKLIGQERLSHIRQYDKEPGFGIFAGLNILPKPTYMNTYSCRCPEETVASLQKELVKKFRKSNRKLYGSGTINLDFHSIPHFGDESQMEKVWCGARGKAVKGANTVFAQDAASNAVMYTRADILRSEEAREIKRFVQYWREVNGDLDETLVFDCKFTTYKVLDELTDDGVKFITLRRRYASLLKQSSDIPKEEWQRLYLPIPKRKRKYVSVHEDLVRLRDCRNEFRQITIKDHGRANPTYVLLNRHDISLKDALIVYAKRWHVEQTLAKLVAFFNLNALSSPLMVRIHFDILWTMIADTLYGNFAADLRRFEDCAAPTLFKRFVNMPGKVVFDGSNFQIKIRKRSHTPVLMGVEKLKHPVQVPWLENRKIEIVWTA